MWQKFSGLQQPIESHKSSYVHHHSQPHFHDYTQLFYCLRGKYRHTVNEQEFLCDDGSLIIVHPGATHSYIVDGESTCTLVQTNIVFNFFDGLSPEKCNAAISFLFLPAFAHELKFNPRPFIKLCGDEKKLADEVFMKLSNFQWKQNLGNLMSARSLFCDLFMTYPFYLSEKNLANISSFIVSKYIPLLHSIYYMNINYSKKIHVDELAAISRICRTDYFRYIKKTLNLTYSQYLTLIRITHAMVLCKFSRYSFPYIADMCGFSDLAHMDVQMRKHISVLPSDMRRNRNINISNYPSMIKSRTEYEQLPPFFYSFDFK